VEPDVVCEQRVELGAQVALQQPHQRSDFSGRALPVLHRKRIKRKNVDSEPGGGFDSVPHGVDAGAVALDARQVALRRPAAIAVHDDRDVRREPLEVELIDEHQVSIPGRDPGQQLVTRHAVCPLSAST
jgi:hypothetical protein